MCADRPGSASREGNDCSPQVIVGGVEWLWANARGDRRSPREACHSSVGTSWSVVATTGELTISGISGSPGYLALYAALTSS